MDTVEARDFLMRFQGVGPKVADCTLLYSGTKYDVFPTDVWVKRVMEELYFKARQALARYRNLPGIILASTRVCQQYLFIMPGEQNRGKMTYST